jgi:hypothetical protein
MNGEDQFEKRLRGQPCRPVPPSWREEILRTARAAAPGSPARAGRQPASSSTVAAWLWGLLWPHPRAWAGLAALWLVVLGFNLATREPGRQEMARRAPRPSPQMRELLRQQEQLLAELVGPIGRAEAARPKPEPAAPQPRSQRDDEFMNA